MLNKTKSLRPARKVKSPCGPKCRLQCSKNFTEEQRQSLFENYWKLGDIEKQREYIANSTLKLEPRYRYVKIGGRRQEPRANNSAFYLRNDGEKIRVCKVFFKNTLDITDRAIRTVFEKKNKIADTVLEPDQRGKHLKHPTVDEAIRNGIKEHIESIPKIDSHYTRANTSKTFIDGSKSIADLHRDYVKLCQENNLDYGNYPLYYRIFTEEFNISFYAPKKDQCEACTSYENAKDEEKQDIKELYDKHHYEKELSRIEKNNDKRNSKVAVAVYDLQAVMHCQRAMFLFFTTLVNSMF